MFLIIAASKKKYANDRKQHTQFAHLSLLFVCFAFANYIVILEKAPIMSSTFQLRIHTQLQNRGGSDKYQPLIQILVMFSSKIFDFRLLIQLQYVHVTCITFTFFFSNVNFCLVFLLNMEYIFLRFLQMEYGL